MPPLASIPDDFPEFTLPPEGFAVKSPSQPSKGIRIDLFVPSGEVEEVQRFFIREVKREGHSIVWTDYEGFEAEVYFSFKSGLVGLMQARATCHDGTLVSFQALEV